jgi:hypothetical protein
MNGSNVRSAHRVIVEDHADDLSSEEIRFDRIPEANEFLMPMALHAATDNLAFQNIECGEEGRRAVAFVIMGHCAGAPFFHRQSRLCAVESLDLRFLIDRQHDRVRRVARITQARAPCFLRVVATPDDPIETMSILWRDFDDNA